MAEPQQNQQKGNGSTPPEGLFERSPAPLGPNPYFPETSPAGNAGQEDGLAFAEPEQQDAPQAQEAPEPTFDVEADAEAGIDVESPEYKHFQAAFTRATQRGQDEQTAMDEMQAEAERTRLFGQEQTGQSQPESFDYQVSWDNFKQPALEEDNALHGYEDGISRIVKQHVEYAVGQVNRQNQEFTSRQKLVQTRDYLTAVVDEIGRVGGVGKKSEALKLLGEYVDIAKANPQKWARFAVNALGITPDASTPSAPQVAPTRKISQQVKGQVRRPSAPSAASPRPPQFNGKYATEQAVSWALDQQLRGKLR